MTHFCLFRVALRLMISNIIFFFSSDEIDSNEDPIEILSETMNHENEQRKSSSIPTLMITVKNEMARPMNEEITVTNGKIKSFFESLLI